MISVYSVVSAILFYNLSLIVLFILRRKTDFMARYTISTLLFLLFLSVLRLLLPVDLQAAHVIRSEHFLPKAIELSGYELPVLGLSIGVMILIVWALGTVYYTVRIASRDAKAYRARKNYPCLKSAQVQRVSSAFKGSYDIRVSPMVSQPYTVGIIRPVIYLPPIELSDEELYFVLLHEIQHIKSKDNLKKLVFLLIEALFWWNPLAHFSTNELEMLIEIQCDAKLTSSMDGETVKKYLHTLLRVMKQLRLDEDERMISATPFAQTYSIKQRFEVLLRRKDRKPKYLRYLLCFVMLVMFLLSYFVILQPYYSSPFIPYDEEYIFSFDDSYILIESGSILHMYGNEVIDVLTEEQLFHTPYNEMTIIGG